MKHRFFLLGLFLLAASATVPTFAAELTINLIAVNASETEEKVKDIEYFLPAELDPEDVVDAGQLKVDYDVDRGGYFVHGEFTFAPKESRNFKLKVKDVWVIQEKEVDVLKKQLTGSLELLKEEPEYPFAQQVTDKLMSKMDFILAQQNNYSENIDRRIEQYRAYKAQMDQIREKVFDSNFLAKEAQAEVEMDQEKTVRFVVEVKNPSEKRQKTVVQKHYLPEEVREEHVVDSKGFTVRFDDEKNRAFLTKEETFEPGETKRYEVQIRDIWHFPTDKVDPVMKTAEEAMNELEGSSYFDSATFLYDRIKRNGADILNSQTEDLTIKKHIGIFRVNERRFAELKDDMEKLEKMIFLMRARELAEMKQGQVKNVLQRLKALRGLAQLSEAIFKKGISVTMTWRIIFGALLFVAFFTTVHFFIWSRRSKNMGEELGPKPGESIVEVPKPGEEEHEEE